MTPGKIGTPGTALLLGGPADGRLMAVQDIHGPIEFAVAPELTARFYDRAAIPEPLLIERVTYWPEALRFFDTILRVHVASGISDEERNDACVRHLLSRDAQACIVSRRPR